MSKPIIVAVVLLLNCLLFGCGKKSEPAPVEVKLKIGDQELGLDQLKRNHKALPIYDAWKDKWFPGQKHWESRRQFKGQRDDVHTALGELDGIISEWKGTAASERAARMKGLIESASAAIGDEFKEKMAWVCRDELMVIMKK